MSHVPTASELQIIMQRPYPRCSFPEAVCKRNFKNSYYGDEVTAVLSAFLQVTVVVMDLPSAEMTVFSPVASHPPWEANETAVILLRFREHFDAAIVQGVTRPNQLQFGQVMSLATVASKAQTDLSSFAAFDVGLSYRDLASSNQARCDTLTVSPILAVGDPIVGIPSILEKYCIICARCHVLVPRTLYLSTYSVKLFFRVLPTYFSSSR